jgi:hypothetical protein
VKANAAANNGMHPTADTLLVIFSYLLGRRVMPGVRRSRTTTCSYWSALIGTQLTT